MAAAAQQAMADTLDAHPGTRFGPKNLVEIWFVPDEREAAAAGKPASRINDLQLEAFSPAQSVTVFGRYLPVG